MGIMEEIEAFIQENTDEAYGEFQRKLIPDAAERIIGVRTPAMRSFAKQLVKRDDVDEFLSALPHSRFEEDQIHAFMISLEKDFNACLSRMDAFLPYVDNWATCDQMSPKVFKKHLPELLPHIEEWLASDKTYTVRFGVGMLMEHYLDDAFEEAYPEKVAALRSEEYYINMMIAWYFATALAKQYEAVLPYLTERRLDRFTHNKAIQKAVESRRISPEQKDYLRTLRRKKGA